MIRCCTCVYEHFAATPVRIGMQQAVFSAEEVIDDVATVCFGVLSGQIAGREIPINFTTIDDTAVSKYTNYLVSINLHEVNTRLQ